MRGLVQSRTSDSHKELTGSFVIKFCILMSTYKPEEISMKTIVALILSITTSTAFAFGSNPFGKGYYQNDNPFGKGYVQDSNPFGKGYVQRDNPFGKGYVQDSNPFGKGYVQDSNPFGKNYVQDKGVFGFGR